MLATIDLTHRQASRVLEQALRARAQVEIEPRSQDKVLRGSLVGREGDLLNIELHDHGWSWPLAALVGAFCEVRTILAGEMYRFCSCIITTLEKAVPQRLMLAAPDVVQVANRRRFDRKLFPQALAIQVWPPGAAQPLVGVLREIGMGGLACQLPRQDADDRLLIDDQVRARFALPGGGEPFDLSASVCVKTPSPDREHLHVGLEFYMPPPGQTAGPVLARLRDLLSQEYMRPSKPDGET